MPTPALPLKLLSGRWGGGLGKLEVLCKEEKEEEGRKGKREREGGREEERKGGREERGVKEEQRGEREREREREKGREENEKVKV